MCIRDRRDAVGERRPQSSASQRGACEPGNAGRARAGRGVQGASRAWHGMEASQDEHRNVVARRAQRVRSLQGLSGESGWGARS
eukprot:14307997-Alexandrium_andersonii.AAC.1